MFSVDPEFRLRHNSLAKLLRLPLPSATEIHAEDGKPEWLCAQPTNTATIHSSGLLTITLFFPAQFESVLFSSSSLRRCVFKFHNLFSRILSGPSFFFPSTTKGVHSLACISPFRLSCHNLRYPQPGQKGRRSALLVSSWDLFSPPPQSRWYPPRNFKISFPRTFTSGRTMMPRAFQITGELRSFNRVEFVPLKLNCDKPVGVFPVLSLWDPKRVPSKRVLPFFPRLSAQYSEVASHN